MGKERGSKWTYIRFIVQMFGHVCIEWKRDSDETLIDWSINAMLFDGALKALRCFSVKNLQLLRGKVLH